LLCGRKQLTEAWVATHQDDEKAWADRAYLRRIFIMLTLILWAFVGAYVYMHGPSERALVAALLIAVVMGGTLAALEYSYNLRRSRGLPPPPVSRSGREVVFPAAYIADDYRVQHKEILFISLLVFVLLAAPFLYALWGIFFDPDDIYRAMGRQKTLADMTASDWTVAAFCGFFLLCGGGLLAMGLRHAKALRQVIGYLEGQAPEANPGLILTPEGVRIFIGVLHEDQMKRFLRRGMFEFSLPWRDIDAWLRLSGVQSKSRGVIYYYRVASKVLDKRLDGTLEIHVKYFAENQDALEREIESHLGKPVEKSRGLENLSALMRNLTGEDKPL